MFIAMMRLLANEAFHLLAQPGVADAFLVVTYRAHEKTFAFRERAGQRGEQQRFELIIGEPVARQIAGKLKIHAPRLDIAGIGAFRRAAGGSEGRGVGKGGVRTGRVWWWP